MRLGGLMKKEPKPTPRKHGVSVRAALCRLNRVLRQHGRQLYRSKPIYQDGRKIYPPDLGRFFIVSGTGNNAKIYEAHVDLEKLARQHHVLRVWETIDDTRSRS
jgi:hypothetical protein